MKIAMVGGGWFGLYLSDYLSRKGCEVLLFESSDTLMGRASYNNQARVHNGYHYPRSVLTALRSRVSFPRFVEDFSDCVCSDFTKYYLIGKHLGKVTASQFYTFCKRIGAYIEEAPPSAYSLVDRKYIEACFSTTEFAFDAIKLKNKLCERIKDSSVQIFLNSTVTKVEKTETSEKHLRITVLGDEREEKKFDVEHVFNCTYSRINYLTSRSSLDVIPLKHEMTEMCLVEVPEPIRKLGITVMCGPFFSVMPFPAVEHNGRYVHSFSHVRYTPHYEWHDKDAQNYQDAYRRYAQDERHTAWEAMRKDASRYIPCLSECRYLDSLWEVKTVLPRSETDDSRPILCRFNYGLNGFHCIMGGKIDNVYDAVAAINNELGI